MSNISLAFTNFFARITQTWQSLPPVTQAVLSVAFIVAGIYLNLILYRKGNRLKTGLYICDQLEQIYFCGYKLSEVYGTRFFQRYRKFVDWGFCGPVAGMSMLALRCNRTARYVYARADRHRYRHCWVEFRCGGTWYVIDPCWSDPCIVRRRYYYWCNQPEIIKTCSHEEFWSYPVSHQFYAKMSRPESSWLLGELMHTYNFDSRDNGRLFNPEISEIQLHDETGFHLNPFLWIDYPQIIFSRRIMHEMMQKPTRERPTAHRLRIYRRQHRLLMQWYEEHLRAHPAEAD